MVAQAGRMATTCARDKIVRASAQAPPTPPVRLLPTISARPLLPMMPLFPMLLTSTLFATVCNNQTHEPPLNGGVAEAHA